MDSTLFIILLAATAGLVAWAITQAVTVYLRGEKRKLHQRLSSETAAARLSSVERSILLANEPNGLSAALARKAILATINRHLMLAWPELQLSRFLGIAGVLGLGGLALSFVITQSWIIAAAVGAAGTYAPFFMLSRKRNSRQRLLTIQLPEALDFLSRVLRAGHSLTTGLQMASEELPQPLSGEFRRAYDQHSLGQSLDDSMKEMAVRIESTDFAFFVSAVLIQRQTGGDLSEVLNNISHMIRQRIRLQAHVRAKTAEGRFTGYILVCFPVGMFALVYVLNPQYANVLLHTTTGQKLIGLSFGLQMMGLFFIRKLTIVKV